MDFTKDKMTLEWVDWAEELIDLPLNEKQRLMVSWLGCLAGDKFKELTELEKKDPNNQILANNQRIMGLITFVLIMGSISEPLKKVS